ncbi:MAG: cytochrome c [Pseudomonadales bacterium]|nr:cytochrome c [Pseudomonadales bacterium]
MKKARFLLLGLLVSALPLPGLAQDTVQFTAEQSAAGRQFYRDSCVICHGTNLANGQFGTPLKGSYFRNKWAGKSLGELVKFTYESMPPDNGMMLALEKYTEVVAFILDSNAIAPGETPISSDLDSLNQVLLPWPVPGK